MNNSKYFFHEFKWDIKKISKSLHLNEEDIIEYFNDGRRCSFLYERRLKYYINGKMAPSEGASYDLLDKNNNKWEVRSLTRTGIYFCPSYMVGSGRRFEKKGFIQKANSIKGYMIADIRSFPRILIYKILSEKIIQWFNEGKLGKTTKISNPDRFINLLNFL